MTKRTIWISAILAAACLLAPVADARIKLKYSGPSGQGDAIWYDDVTGVTQMVMTAQGVTNATINGGTIAVTDLSCGTLTATAGKLIATNGASADSAVFVTAGAGSNAWLVLENNGGLSAAERWDIKTLASDDFLYVANNGTNAMILRGGGEVTFASSLSAASAALTGAVTADSGSFTAGVTAGTDVAAASLNVTGNGSLDSVTAVVVTVSGTLSMPDNTVNSNELATAGVDPANLNSNGVYVLATASIGTLTASDATVNGMLTADSTTTTVFRVLADADIDGTLTVSNIAVEGKVELGTGFYNYIVPDTTGQIGISDDLECNGTMYGTNLLIESTATFNGATLTFANIPTVTNGLSSGNLWASNGIVRVYP